MTTQDPEEIGVKEEPNRPKRRAPQNKQRTILPRNIEHIMRRPEVCNVSGLSGSSIDRLEAAGDFPRRCELGNGKWKPVGWSSKEVYAWLDQRLAERDAKLQAAEDDDTLDSDDTVEDNEEEEISA